METNTEPSTSDMSHHVCSDAPVFTSQPPPPPPPPPPSNAADDEIRRRKILSKLWGKGNKLSHKVRELDKSTINSSDSTTSNETDQQSFVLKRNDLSSKASSIIDLKISTDDSSNSISISKPLAVVKPIVVVKSGLVVAHAAERTRVNSEGSATNIIQTVEETKTTTTTVIEQRSSTTSRTSEKKKTTKSKKEENSKKKKTETKERHSSSRSRRRRQSDEHTSKKSSSSKNYRRDQNDEKTPANHHQKSSRRHSSSTKSVPDAKRRSPPHESDRSQRKSTTSRNDEKSLSKRSNVSPNNRYHSSHRHRSSRTPSPSRRSTTDKDRSTQKNHSTPPLKDEISSASSTSATTKSTPSSSNHRTESKSSNVISPSDNDTHRSSRTNTDDRIKQKKQSPSPSKHEDEHGSHRQKTSSSRFDKRSSSRHRSPSRDDKPVEPLSSIVVSPVTPKDKPSLTSTVNGTGRDQKRRSDEKETTVTKSSRASPVDDRHRVRRSSYDRYRRDHHDRSPRVSSRHHYHRYRDWSRSPERSSNSSSLLPSHTYYGSSSSTANYVHHHHHHHYRSSHRHYRRSPTPPPRSRHNSNHHRHRSIYFSSPSSSSSLRTSSSSSRSTSSYTSMSRSSSSRSSSPSPRDHRRRISRRSPTLEKLFLKASESIESVSTQKNPLFPSTNRIIPIRASSISSDMQMSPSTTSNSDPHAFYPDSFVGFSAPPPPFITPQRCLKEVTTDDSSKTIYLPPPQPALSISDETTTTKSFPPKTPGITKPARTSRFSDVAPAPVPSASETSDTGNLPVNTPLNYIQLIENIVCLPATRRQQGRRTHEVMECECTTSEYDRSRGIKACGQECLNRMLLIECGSMCPCGQYCTNRRFQRRSSAGHKLALFNTPMKGYGIRTIAPIDKGRFLVEYVGEVIDMDELVRRYKRYKRDGHKHQYVMSLIHGTVIDSTMKGNWARFVNHSCEPNCAAEKWLVNGEYRMGFFAKRDLAIDEEITIDYRFETFGAVDAANEKCYCGAPACRGTISVRNNKNSNSNKRQNRSNLRQPLDDDDLLDILKDNDTDELIIPKTVDEIRQLIQVMSRTDSENGRTIELDLVIAGAQRQAEIPRLFVECNGLHVLCAWLKDILVDDVNDEQPYSNQFKLRLLEFLHRVTPIKDRTTVTRYGLFEQVTKKMELLSSTNQSIGNEDEQVKKLVDDMVDHLNDPVVAKIFHLHSIWMSLKERYIIPKRKESSQSESDHYHHHHHHHHHRRHRESQDENSNRFNVTPNGSRPSTSQQPKPSEYRSSGRRSLLLREIPRSHEQQLSRDERRKLIEQEYEDAEKAKVAAAAAANFTLDSPGGQNEPPNKKQRKSDGAEPMIPRTPPLPSLAASNSSFWSFPNNIDRHQTDQTLWIHQHLSQIPIDYIHSYLKSTGQETLTNSTASNDEPPLPPPARPDDEAELSRIIRLPSGWSVTVCPSDSSIYYYNRQTMATSWTLPSSSSSSAPVSDEQPPPPADLSPLSSAHIDEQRRPLVSSSFRSISKLSKHHYRHSHGHRHHHHHSNNKRKRSSAIESSIVKEEFCLSNGEEIPVVDQIQQEETEAKTSIVEAEISTVMDEINQEPEATTVNDHQPMKETDINSSPFKNNRDLLRKHISQYVHTMLKPYTKRTCKQARIVCTDDMKYLVKKFTLAVLDKEVEKAKNDGIPLSSLLTERVRMKTEVYVKKYMNKMGPVFQRHDTATAVVPLPFLTSSTTETKE